MNIAIEPKLPPQAIEAEQSLLGSMMLSSRILDDVISILDKSDFYRQDHQNIYESILELASKNQAVDAVTVSGHLENKGLIKEIGGMSYIATLVKNTPNASSWKSYCDVVVERSKLRKLIQLGGSLIDQAYDFDSDSNEVINNFSNQIEAISESETEQINHDMKSSLDLALDGIQHRFKNGDAITGMPVHIDGLNNAISGLNRGALIVIAGRPSMGKTALASCLADQPIRDGKIVKHFSMEMSVDEIQCRNLSRWANIPHSKIKVSSQLQEAEFTKMVGTIGTYRDYNYFLDDSAGLHFNQIRARCRSQKRKTGLDIVVIDYLQLMSTSAAGTKAEAIGEVTKALKNMARELDVCVILLSQLNRSVETRPNKRPVMSDLRESGAIEQDADIIIMLYRDEVYNSDTQAKGLAELLIRKNRGGEIKTIMSQWVGEYMQFNNYEPRSFQ